MLNNFVILSRHNINAYIPSYRIEIHGIIRGVDIYLMDEEIMDQLIIENKTSVKGIQRFNHKWGCNCKPTQSVKITFNYQILPKYINLYLLRILSEPFKLSVVQYRKYWLLDTGNCVKNIQKHRYGLPHDTYSAVFSYVNLYRPLFWQYVI